jgi:PAS domain S-box-containing protein
VLLVLLPVLLVVGGFLDYDNLRRVHSDMAMVAHTQEVLGASARLLSAVQEAETGLRGYLLTGQAEFLEPYKEGISRYPADYERLKRLMSANPEQQQRLKALLPVLETTRATQAAAIDAYGAGDVQRAHELVARDRGKSGMADIRRRIAQIEAQESRLLTSRVRVSQSQFRVATEFAGATALASLLLVLLFVPASRADLRVKEELQSAVRKGEEALVAAIRDSEASFRAAVAAVEGVVWTTDSAGKMTGEQPAWAALTGQRREEYQGYGWAAAVHPDDAEATLASWQAAVEKRVAFAFEHRVRRHDGDWRTCSIRAVPMLGKQGEIRDWVGVHTDVTVLRALERERAELLEAERAARSEAEAASRVKDEFLATLSHELRTPLTVIVGWSRLLLRRCAPESEELRKGLKLIGDNAMSQARIITDLLDMSRIAAGKLALEVRPVELSELLSQCVASQALIAKEKGVMLKFAGEAQPQRVLADPARLQQVMGNLLTNAIKFTPASGSVEVTTRRAAAGYEILVADTGEGIAAEFLPHLFGRFRQADGSSARRHGGLGLGLAIVHQLVESHGGWVRADSEGPGRGACFTIWLPEAAPAEPPEPSEVFDQSGEVHGLKGLRVLVVEDQPEMLEQLQRVLHERGAVVTTARSAREALAILTGKERFEILVSDIGMPGMDGFELMRALRRQPAFGPERLAAVAVTAFARAEDKERCLEAGFQAHVSKPYEAGRLVAILRQLAKGRGREHGRHGSESVASEVAEAQLPS